MCRSAPHRRRHCADEGGFTLLEALIALLVLAVGLLGLAGLQVQGLKYNTDAYARSRATFFAYDLIERMRLVRLNTADDATGVAAMTAFTQAPDPQIDCSDPAVARSGAVDKQLSCWYQAMRDPYTGLPGAQATVTRTSDGGTPGDPRDDVYRITIQWYDRTTAQNVTQTWTFQV